jgi:hypothetical protein
LCVLPRPCTRTSRTAMKVRRRRLPSSPPLMARRLSVFNFFEPLHYFKYNTGFQTWELSPEYAIRSWAYILLHWPFAHIIPTLMSLPKVCSLLLIFRSTTDQRPLQRASFFCLRIGLGVICSVCEGKFYRSVVENINERVGRYTLGMMILSAGMWNAGVGKLRRPACVTWSDTGYSIPSLVVRYEPHHARILVLPRSKHHQPPRRPPRNDGNHQFRDRRHPRLALRCVAGAAVCGGRGVCQERG